MLCPECNHKLAITTLTTGVGQIVLDYCNNCGGVWSDQGEVNFLKEKDLEPLFDVLPSPSQPLINSTKYCPKDRSILELFKSESVPTNVDIYRCGRCGGNFFPFQMLQKFKTAQKTKLDYFKIWKIPLHSVYAILLPILLIIVLGTGMIATLTFFNQGTDVRIRASESISKPLVINPFPDQALINFVTDTSAASKIKYWLRSDEVTEVWVSTTIQTHHTITLSNLIEGRNYSYQILLVEPTPITSPTYTFSTKK